MATKIPKRNRHKNQEITKEARDSYTLSLATSMVAVFLVFSFLKAMLNQNYLVNVYIDSAVGVVALFIFIFQFRYQLSVYQQYHNSKVPMLIFLLSILIGLVLVLFTLKTFDISGIILIIGLFVTKKRAEKEWQK